MAPMAFTSSGEASTPHPPRPPLTARVLEGHRPDGCDQLQRRDELLRVLAPLHRDVP